MSSTEPNPAPVALPPGSFDFEALQKGLDKAAKAADKNYAAAVDQALLDTNDNKLAVQDSRYQAGFVERPVEHPTLGITENMLVFDPKVAEKAGDDGAPAGISVDAGATAVTAPATGTVNNLTADPAAPKE